MSMTRERERQRMHVVLGMSLGWVWVGLGGFGSVWVGLSPKLHVVEPCVSLNPYKCVVEPSHVVELSHVVEPLAALPVVEIHLVPWVGCLLEKLSTRIWVGLLAWLGWVCLLVLDPWVCLLECPSG